MDRKKARLATSAGLLHTGKVSTRGLIQILNKVKGGAQPYTSSSSLSAANQQRFLAVLCLRTNFAIDLEVAATVASPTPAVADELVAVLAAAWNSLQSGGHRRRRVWRSRAAERSATFVCDRRCLSCFRSRTSAGPKRFQAVRRVETLDLDGGGEFEWEYCDPALLLCSLVEARPDVQALYSSALATSPPSLDSPWHLAVAWDEFVPGNKLKVDNRRKTLVLSFTFLELGPHAVTCSDGWVTPVCLRSSAIERVNGGLPRVLAQYLLHQLFGPSGLSSSGVPLKIGDKVVLLFARVSNLLSDGEGLKKGLDWKGFAGLKPCLKHFNVFKKDSDLAGRREGYVEITCFDPSKFRSWSSQEFNQAVDLITAAGGRVEEGTMTQTRFNELEQMLGLNYNPFGLTSNLELRSNFCCLDVLTYDWVHCMLQEGVFNHEVQAFLKCAEPFGVNREAIRLWLKDDSWRFPCASKDKFKALHRIFDTARSSDKDPDRLRGNCSEMLGVYTLIRHYFDLHVPVVDDLRLAKLSFDAVCRVIDCLLTAKRLGGDPMVQATQLRAALSHHLECHQAAYGVEHIKPKHHWMLDVPPQVVRDGLVLDTFVIERRHLLVKAVADHIDNTAHFERNVLSSVLTCLFHQGVSRLGHGLIGRTEPWAEFPGAYVAGRTQVGGLEVAAGDFVFRGDFGGFVLGCAFQHGSFFAIVEVWLPSGLLVGCSRVYTSANNSEVWHAAELQQCPAWCFVDEGVVALSA
jgi:hypothetical protein